tara:strand:+ start:340 stop:888 length:549 start_codon:yes stop_codon:yes gene_type:complete
MSSHFGRMIYDDCFNDEFITATTGPGNYRLSCTQINDNACHSLNGPRNDRPRNSSEVTQADSLGERVDLETSLTCRDEPNSRCVKNRTLDEKKKKLNNKMIDSKECDNNLLPEYSRLEHPIDNFRGLSTFELQVGYPLTDPKSNVFNGHNETFLENQNINSRRGTFTRLESKDLYRAKYFTN